MGYNIYREGNVSGQYDLVQTLSNSNVWVDNASDARVRSYRYKIAGITALGCETEVSLPHKTMHLTISAGLNNSWNLIWTPYEGVSYETYNIYRATSAGSEMALIGTMPSGNTSFSDFTAPAGYVYYMVEIIVGHACEEYSASATRSFKAAPAFASIRSNLATNNPIGIDDAAVDELRISPNPMQDNFYVGGIEENTPVTLSDVSGKIVLQTVVAPNEAVSVANLPQGVYMLKAAGKVVKIIKN